MTGHWYFSVTIIKSRHIVTRGSVVRHPGFLVKVVVLKSKVWDHHRPKMAFTLSYRKNYLSRVFQLGDTPIRSNGDAFQ